MAEKTYNIKLTNKPSPKMQALIEKLKQEHAAKKSVDPSLPQDLSEWTDDQLEAETSNFTEAQIAAMGAEAVELATPAKSALLTAQKPE